jgi:hypothetical protein
MTTVNMSQSWSYEYIPGKNFQVKPKDVIVKDKAGCNVSNLSDEQILSNACKLYNTVHRDKFRARYLKEDNCIDISPRIGILRVWIGYSHTLNTCDIPDFLECIKTIRQLSNLMDITRQIDNAGDVSTNSKKEVLECLHKNIPLLGNVEFMTADAHVAGKGSKRYNIKMHMVNRSVTELELKSLIETALIDLDISGSPY